MFAPECICCGRITYDLRIVEFDAATYVCGFCAKRSRLCQHNLGSRIAAGGKNAAFSSSMEPVLVVLEEGEVKRYAVQD